MNVVCDIAAAARPGCRAKRGLPVLFRLRKRASDSLLAAGKTVAAVPAESDDFDDLGHLSASVKLRRIGSPPSSTVVGPIADGVTSPLLNDRSPQSPRSVATSATLAETGVCDLYGGVLHGCTYNGSVQPPPLVFPPIAPDTPAYSEVSPSRRPESQELQSGFTFVWPLHTECSPVTTLGSSQPDVQEKLEIGGEHGWSTAVIDGSRMDEGLNYTEMDIETIGEMVIDEPFDFDTFVNQLGAGELGISGN